MLALKAENTVDKKRELNVSYSYISNVIYLNQKYRNNCTKYLQKYKTFLKIIPKI